MDITPLVQVRIVAKGTVDVAAIQELVPVVDLALKRHVRQGRNRDRGISQLQEARRQHHSSRAIRAALATASRLSKRWPIR